MIVWSDWSDWSDWSYKREEPDQIHRTDWSGRPVLCPKGGTDGLGSAVRIGCIPTRHRQFAISSRRWWSP
jgi:hypothetical protein